MTHIQMTDGNSSDLGLSEELANEELTNEELTDEELSAIDGGLLGAGGSILNDTVNGNPINWGSAANGAIGGLGGGLIGASLAGAD
jgi:bacteriocin-like protein